MNTRTARPLSAVIVLLLLAAWAGPGKTAGPTRALILHSYHQNLEWSRGLQDSLERTLLEARPDLAIATEYLDLARMAPLGAAQRSGQAFLELLRVKLAAAPPDVVIVADNPALEFYLTHRTTLAPGVPVVFCGVNGFRPEMIAGQERITGVAEEPSFAQTLETARALFPGRAKLLVLGENSLTFAANKALLENALAAMPGVFTVEYHLEASMAAIEERLAGLGSGWLAFPMVRPAEAGRLLPMSEASSRMATASPAPLLAGWDFWMGHGVLGGKVVSSQGQGRTAGSMALAILAGIPVSSMPVETGSPNRFVFDHLALERFGLRESALPRGSEVINRPASFYRENKTLVLAFVGFTLLLLLALTGLIVNAARRAEAERKLQGQYNLLQSLLEAMPAAVFFKDVRGVYQGCNKAFETFLGLDRSRITGRTVDDIAKGHAAKRFKEMDALVLADGQPRSYEEHVDLPEGRRLFLFNKAAYRDAAGGLAGLVGVAIDLTERVANEEALRESREKYRRLLQGMVEGYASTSLDGKLAEYNAAFRDMLGYSDEELLNLRYEDFTPDKWHDMEKAIVSGLVLRRGYSEVYEKEYRRKDGVVFPVELRTYLMKDAKGEPVGLWAIVHDITERKRVQELMIQSEKMMSVGGLAAGMAHEINNPLSGILQSIQVIQARTRKNMPANLAEAEKAGCPLGDVQEYLEKRGVFTLMESMREAASRAARIVANMLEFSRRSENGKVAVELTALVKAALDLCANEYDLTKKYDFRHIEIVTSHQPGLPPVSCTPTQIEQVIMNILRNSAQAMEERPEGSPTPRIEIATSRENGWARIDIADNGPGMPEEVRKRIFEPFFTTKKPGSGTGLGLSVSYFIVTSNHDGQLDVESAPGKGTRFVIRLPLQERQEG